MAASAPAPSWVAAATLERSSPDRLAAVFRIQKTMPVTRTTVNTLSKPPSISWPLLERTSTEKVRIVAKLAETATAPTTPSHTGAEDTRRPSSPVRRSAASRMLITSPASSPSRNPIKRLGNASAQVIDSKVSHA